MTVKSIDVYGIKERLRKDDSNKQFNKQVLQLIDALERSNQRWQAIANDAIKKLKTSSVTLIGENSEGK